MRALLPLLTILIAGVAAAAAPAPPPYYWRTFADDPTQISLWRDGVQLGNYKLDTDQYFRRLAPHRFEDQASDLPAPLPERFARKRCGCSKDCKCRKGKCDCSEVKRCNRACKCVQVIGGAGYVEEDGTPNYGLDTGKIPKSPEHILNGREVTKDQLLEALGAPQIPDDAGLLCVTAIGPKEMLDRVTADFASAGELAAWRDKVKFKAYEPSHWAVAGLGFVSPSIYFQSPTGKVLWRETNYPGAAALAEDLRRLDPLYDPNKDPGPRQPLPDASGGEWGSLLATVGAGLGGLGCFASFAFVCFSVLVLLWRRARSADLE